MGVCDSKIVKSPEESKNDILDEEVDKKLAADQEREANRIKLLLLGAGESGKSTVLKQLRLLYGKALSETELQNYRRQVHDNIFDTIESMCRICVVNFPSHPIIDSPEFQKIFTKDLSNDGKEFPELTLDYVAAISYLWSSTPFQMIWESAFPSSYVPIVDTKVTPESSSMGFEEDDLTKSFMSSQSFFGSHSESQSYSPSYMSSSVPSFIANAIASKPIASSIHSSNGQSSTTTTTTNTNTTITNTATTNTNAPSNTGVISEGTTTSSASTEASTSLPTSHEQSSSPEEPVSSAGPTSPSPAINEEASYTPNPIHSPDTSNSTSTSLMNSPNPLSLALTSRPCIQYNSNHAFNEGVKVFLDKINEVSKLTYVPTAEDILTVRLKTIGVRVEKFIIDDREYCILDVGGQKNERKKWMHFFSDTHGVLFLSSLNDYDNQLREDSKTNRMVDSIDLFHQIMEEKYLNKSSIILFLNKSDLFKEKIAHIPINSIKEFSDYSGPPNSYLDGINYFADKFKSRISNKRVVYSHVTCATDGQALKLVFDVCRVIITKAHLMTTGFIS